MRIEKYVNGIRYPSTKILLVTFDHHLIKEKSVLTIIILKIGFMIAFLFCFHG